MMLIFIIVHLGEETMIKKSVDFYRRIMHNPCNNVKLDTLLTVISIWAYKAVLHGIEPPIHHPASDLSVTTNHIVWKTRRRHWQS